MSGGSRMDHQTLGIADVGQMAEEFQAFDEFDGRAPAAFDAEAYQRTLALWPPAGDPARFGSR